MYFNDATKIILETDGVLFRYVDRRQADKQETINEYKLTDYPKELGKKVTLLQHFRSYLEVKA